MVFWTEMIESKPKPIIWFSDEVFNNVIFNRRMTKFYLGTALSDFNFTITVMRI